VDPKVIQQNLEGFQIFDPEDSFCVFDKTGEPIHFTTSGLKKVPSRGHLCLKDTEYIPNELILRYMSLEGNPGKTDLEILKLSRDSFTQDFIVQNAGSEIYSNFSAGDLMTGWLASAVSRYNGGPRRAWCGAGVLIPRIYLDSNGAFDERFFLYYEDTEFSYRGILAETLPILCPNLIVKHKHSALTGKNTYSRSKAIWRSRAAFVSLTSGKAYAITLIAAVVVRSFFSLVRRRTTFRHFLKFLLPEVVQSLLGFVQSILPKPKRGS
jgi:GT2 family glycosyltransferase